MNRLLDEGAVGEPAHITAGQLIGGMGGWLGDPAHGGGPLLYIGTHVLDQVLWVAGRKATHVFADVELTDSGVDAHTAITIHFEGGLTAQVLSSQKMGGRYGWLDVIGSAGRVRTEWESNVLYVESQRLEAYRHPTEIEVPLDPYLPRVQAEPIVSVVGIKYIRMWAAEMAEFIAAITEDRQPSVNGEDAVRVLEVTDAAIQSGRSGSPIEL